MSNITANTYSSNTLSFSTGISTQSYQCPTVKEAWRSPLYGNKTLHVSPPIAYTSKGQGGCRVKLYFGNCPASSEPSYDWL